MSSNLELMQKIAWTNSHKRKSVTVDIIIESTPTDNANNPWFQMAKLQPRNYCDDDLDKLYNPKDWFDDTWWRF